MNLKIMSLALILLVCGSTSVYALEEGTCGQVLEDRIGKYLDMIEKAIKALEGLNSSEDKEVKALLDDAGEELDNAREQLSEGDCEQAAESGMAANQLVRDAAAMLQITEENAKSALEAKYQRLVKVQSLAEAARDRFNYNGVDTPRIDILLLLSSDCLGKASSHLDKGNLVLANREMESAKGYLNEVQNIIRESIYKYQLMKKVETYLGSAPDKIGRAETFLYGLESEHGLDVSYALGLLDEYSDKIGEAEMAFEEGRYEDCIRDIRSSILISNLFLLELDQLLSNIDGV